MAIRRGSGKAPGCGIGTFRRPGQKRRAHLLSGEPIRPFRRKKIPDHPAVFLKCAGKGNIIGEIHATSLMNGHTDGRKSAWRLPCLNPENNPKIETYLHKNWVCVNLKKISPKTESPTGAGRRQKNPILTFSTKLGFVHRSHRVKSPSGSEGFLGAVGDFTCGGLSDSVKFYSSAILNNGSFTSQKRSYVLIGPCK